MTKIPDTDTHAPLPGATGYDPIEDRLRQNIRATIETLFEEESEAFIGRCHYGRGGGSKKGCRHGHRDRRLTATFGTGTVRVPRARIEDDAGKISGWRSTRRRPQRPSTTSRPTRPTHPHSRCWTTPAQGRAIRLDTLVPNWRRPNPPPIPTSHRSKQSCPQMRRICALSKSPRTWAGKSLRKDPERLCFEATARTPVFYFADDVVVVVTSREGGSRVDMRSVSRVGRSDQGVNAARIRAFQQQFRD